MPFVIHIYIYNDEQGVNNAVLIECHSQSGGTLTRHLKWLNNHIIKLRKENNLNN